MAGFLYVYTGLLCRGKITIGWVISTTPTVIEINDTHTLNSLKLALSVKNITLDANPVASAAESEKVEEYSNYIGFYCTDLSDDIDTFTIEPLTGETDFTGYNNLLNILGATNVYTETSVTLEQMGDWNGWKRSKNFGARLPISLYLDNSKLVVGFTNNFEPITESTAGEDKITANGIYTPRLIFRRGFKISIRLSYNQIRLLNIFQNNFRSPVKVRFQDTSIFDVEQDFTMLLHKNKNDNSIVYPTIGLYEVSLTLLGDRDV